MTRLSRRRFLAISAACAAVPAMAGTSAQWRGIALGAPASLRLEGLSDAQAAPIFAAVEAELNRLEQIFSLYRPTSQISRLNQAGVLHHPAPELLQVLGLCSTLHEATGGAFDPSIQPLWAALASGASASDLRAANAAVGWRGISLRPTEIRLPRPGKSALTLNGIAQGAITDRISALIKSCGLQNVLVNMGEIYALGHRSDGQGWRVGLEGPDRTVRKTLQLTDRAVATSDPTSVMLTDQHGHILSPDQATLAGHGVSVSANSAALADGLSTALCLLPEHKAHDIVAIFPEAVLERIG